jgi:hypothetical protein
MKFNLVEDRKVKIQKADLEHPVKHTQRKQPPKPKKTRDARSPGKQKNRIWISEDRDFEIHRYSGKHKLIDLRYCVPQLIKGGITFEQAVELAEEARRESI